MSRAHIERWTMIALWLVVGTMAYNVVEAVAALFVAVTDESVALMGFGMDSTIEVAAAAALLWRLRLQAQGAPAAHVERAERGVARFVGVTFLALASYVCLDAGWTLWAGRAPSESAWGIAIAVASLVIMPAVSLGKLRAAKVLGSAALRAEAKETLACSYLSLTLVVGLVANALAGWWWADPAAALLMVPWLVYEGWGGVFGGDACACQGGGLGELLGDRAPQPQGSGACGSPGCGDARACASSGSRLGSGEPAARGGHGACGPGDGAGHADDLQPAPR